MAGLTDDDVAKLYVETESRDFSIQEIVMAEDGSKYNNFVENAYSFGGGAVVVKDKRDPYDDSEEMSIVWRS